MENVVKEPTNPVPIAVIKAGGKEDFLNTLAVNQANKKLPIRLIAKVTKGNELFVKKKRPITYLKIAPRVPAMPTNK